jgi:hypothetical protein
LTRLRDHLAAGQCGLLEAIECELARRTLNDEQMARVGRELFRIRKGFAAERGGPRASRMLATLSLELGLHAGNDRLRATAEGVRDLLMARLDGVRAQQARELLNPLLDTPAPAAWLRLLRLGKKVPRRDTNPQDDLLSGVERICRAAR